MAPVGGIPMHSYVKCLVVSTALAVLLLPAGSSLAQFQLDSGYLTFNAAYTASKLKDYDKTLDGGAAVVTYEMTLGGQPVSFGFSVGHQAGEENFTYEGEEARAEFTSWPVALTGRYFFGSHRVVPYIGLGMGVSFSTLEVQVGNEFKALSNTNISLGVPLGAYIFLSQHVYINLNYTPYWVDSQFIDGLTHIGTLGLGFQFPN